MKVLRLPEMYIDFIDSTDDDHMIWIGEFPVCCSKFAAKDVPTKRERERVCVFVCMCDGDLLN